MGDDRPDLERLAATAAEVAAAWGLALGEPFALARYSFVAPAGDGAVLKVVPPEDDEADDEADALALWAGDGAVRLLRHDPARRALLLERARPGTDLADVPEEDATSIAVDLAGRLWKGGQSPGLSPVPTGRGLSAKSAQFISIDRAGELWKGGQSPGLSPVPSGRFRSVHDHVPRWLANAPPGTLADLARDLYARLDHHADTLVHGDFHHHNVLRSARGWLAIDPKPMLGEAEYDVASFLWNPLPARLRVEHLERRLAAFAAVGLDEGRMRAWTVIRGAYLQPQEAAALRALV